ncbi:MAG: hypothetical protein RSC24_06385 [Clostridium sp.]
MKIDNQKRKEIWDAYCDLEFKLRELKTIVQNEIEIKEEELIQHTNATDSIIHKLAVLNREIWDYATRCLEDEQVSDLR